MVDSFYLNATPDMANEGTAMVWLIFGNNVETLQRTTRDLESMLLTANNKKIVPSVQWSADIEPSLYINGDIYPINYKTNRNHISEAIDKWRLNLTKALINDFNMFLATIPLHHRLWSFISERNILPLSLEKNIQELLNTPINDIFVVAMTNAYGKRQVRAVVMEPHSFRRVNLETLYSSPSYYYRDVDIVIYENKFDLGDKLCQKVRIDDAIYEFVYQDVQRFINYIYSHGRLSIPKIL